MEIINAKDHEITFLKGLLEQDIFRFIIFSQHWVYFENEENNLEDLYVWIKTFIVKVEEIYAAFNIDLVQHIEKICINNCCEWKYNFIVALKNDDLKLADEIYRKNARKIKDEE